ncbi:MAG: hypothetical protein AAFN11_02675, partial [Chloroflexota bacterium]
MVNTSRTKATTRDIIGFYTVNVGKFSLTVLSDGTLEIDPHMWGATAPEGELQALMQSQGINVDVWYSGLHCLLVETEDKHVYP